MSTCISYLNISIWDEDVEYNIWRKKLRVITDTITHGSEDLYKTNDDII